MAAEGVIQVLLAEDDERLASLLIRYLEGEGLVVSWTRTGPEALLAARSHPYDVLLLDLMLPGQDGLSVCAEIRAQRDVPIIMVSAREGDDDRIRGLEAGADDYLCKPFSSRELLARIRAQVRRARGQAGPVSQPLLVGPLTLLPASLSATLNGRNLSLTSYEFSLLRVLAERAGNAVSREQLLDRAKGSAEEAFDRSVDVHVFRLRQKLEEDPKHPKLLLTVRGAGYMLALH